MRARTRSPTPACARPKSARSPKKKPAFVRAAKRVDRAERAKAEARKRDEEERRKHDEETKRKADEVAKKRFGAETATAAKPARPRPALEADEEEAPRSVRRGSAASRPAPAPKPTRHGRGKAPRPAHRRHRPFRRRGARTFGRRLPSPRPAHDRPSRQRAEGKDRPRSDHSGDDHHPGAGQPHGRARRRRDPAS